MKKTKLLKLPSRGLVTISLVSLVLGFILAYSYSISSEDKEENASNLSSFQEQEKYRESLWNKKNAIKS